MGFHREQGVIKSIAAIIVVCAALASPASAVASDVAANFNPNVLIPDAAFADTKTFGGPAGIQRFLESKGSVLADASPGFLSMLAEPDDPALKAALGDPEPDLGRLRTAAELIWDAGQASGLNPQVILVTLNKEQGLITNAVSRDRLQRALNHAMGFDCPDASGCGNLFPGFYYQLFGNVDAEGNRYLGAAKSLMRSFNAPGGRGPTVANAAAKVGDDVLLDNTTGDFSGVFLQQMVTLGNRATAALYRYTPHVFNGNYNFWRFFTAWFKYPNGTIVVTPERTFFIIEDGQRERLPFFTADARKLDVSAAIAVSPTELDGYPAGPAYGPPDDTVVKSKDGYFVFKDGVMHPVTAFVLAQRKLDRVKPLPLSDADSGLFMPGPQLTPTDGTVLRGKTDATAFLVDGGVLKRYSAFTFKQRGADKLLQAIPDGEISLYPKSGYVPPLDGTIVRSKSSGGNAYLVSRQRRLPLTPELFRNRGFKEKDVVTLSSDEEMASIPLGPSATPAERTFFSYGGTRELFIFKGGAKHPISPFVARQRRITPDYVFEASIAGAWPDGIAIPPRDGTLVKSDAGPTPYLVANGQLRRLTDALMKNLGLKSRDVQVMPDADFSALAKGGYAAPKENSWFTTGGTLKSPGPVYVYRNGVKRYIPAFVAGQRGMTPDFIFAPENAADWPDGAAMSPRDGTLVKSDKESAVYLVSKGVLRPLSDAAFKNRRYKSKDVKTLPASDVAILQKGDLIAK
ncbi:MAG: hypothetical protein RL272_940 [Candidatus Parcubacteria bacterium]|jgi:hypothetical protein